MVLIYSNAFSFGVSTRPYGLWYEKWFPNININYVSYNCIIAIHRNHIYNRSKSFYEELIKEAKKLKLDIDFKEGIYSKSKLDEIYSLPKETIDKIIEYMKP